MVNTKKTWYKIPVRKVKISSYGACFIILYLIGILFQTGLLHWYYLTAILIAAFFTGMGLLNKLNKMRFGHSASEFDKITKMILFQWLIIIIYNCILYILNIGEREFLKSSFVQITFPIFVLTGGWGSYNFFKENTIHYIEYTIYLSYLIMLPMQMYKMGISAFFNGIATIFTGLSINNPFETNSDGVFALGLLLLYYSHRYKLNRNKEYWHIAFLILLILLGGKRIEIFALILLFMFSASSKIFNEKKIYIIQIIISITMVLTIFAYIILTLSGRLQTYFITHNIEAMGRLQMWDYVSQFASFSSFFLGHGFSFSTLMLEKNQIWMVRGNATPLHGVILALYNDMGIYIFSFWLVYNLIILPRILRKKYGIKFMSIFWTLTVYLFILYLTESSINHFITQSVYIVCILQASSDMLKGKMNKKEVKII